MIYIGIDPGVSGGIAILDDTGNVIEVHRMPDTPADVLALLLRMREDARAMLEQVSAGVWGQGKMGGRMGVSSAFTFGRGVGHLEAFLLAAQIPTDRVQPARWQQALGCRTHGDKNISKARAQQLWPGRKITHAIADALLLAEYGRRLHRGHLAATNNGGRDGKEGERHEESRQAGEAGKAREGREAGARGQGGKTPRAGAAVPGAPRHGAGSDRATR